MKLLGDVVFAFVYAVGLGSLFVFVFSTVFFFKPLLGIIAHTIC